MEIIMPTEITLPENYQNKVNGLLQKKSKETATGLLALIEQADWEFSDDTFWNIAYSLMLTVPDETYRKALKQEAHDSFNEELPNRARVIYRILERDYEH